jgi:hypothetical protein
VIITSPSLIVMGRKADLTVARWNALGTQEWDKKTMGKATGVDLSACGE